MAQPAALATVTHLHEEDRNPSNGRDEAALIAAMNRSQATIEFDLTGKVLTANENFLKTLGYSLQDIQGQHHRMFCDEAFVQSPEYLAFWEKLKQGEFQAGEYKRLGRGGKEV